MMPLPADASIQKSYVCLCKPSPHCVDTQQSPIDFRNCGRKRFGNLLIAQKKLSTNKGARGRPAFVLRRHSPLPEAANRLTVIFQFFRKRQACSWETQQRNEGATVSIVSRLSFLSFWRDGSRRS